MCAHKSELFLFSKSYFSSIFMMAMKERAYTFFILKLDS